MKGRGRGERRRKWVDKKQATTFQLVHRTNEYEGGMEDGEAPSARVLKPVEDKNLVNRFERAKAKAMREKEKRRAQRQMEGREDEDSNEEEEDPTEVIPARAKKRLDVLEETKKLVRNLGDAVEVSDEEYYEGSGDENREEGSDFDDEYRDNQNFDERDYDDDDEQDYYNGNRSNNNNIKKQPRDKEYRNEYELGEYGFPDDGYDYSQHFKQIGGGHFMKSVAIAEQEEKEAAKNNKKTFKLKEETQNQKQKQKQKQKSIDEEDDEDEDEEEESVETKTEELDFLQDTKNQKSLNFNPPEDVVQALEQPDTFEELNDDFIVDADERSALKGQDLNQGPDDDLSDDMPELSDDDQHPTKQSNKNQIDEEYDVEEIEEDAYHDDRGVPMQIMSEKLDTLLRNQYNDDEDDMDPNDPSVRGKISSDQILSMLESDQNLLPDLEAENLQILVPKAKNAHNAPEHTLNVVPDTPTVDWIHDYLIRTDQKKKNHKNSSDPNLDQNSDDDDIEQVHIKQYDKEDCESITSTWTNTENIPVFVEDLEGERIVKIKLNRKTGLPVMGGKRERKEEEKEEGVNRGEGRKKEEGKEEKKERKKRVKEERKEGRIGKKNLKVAYKTEEIVQARQQARNGKQSVLKL
eukprot:TRINITY_DN1072_c3_g1_i1.p1 TRINITY_DN1072_c3_g1~~TRINITY_DN1072_c3_g1_i1.p1  ORF type:complete len:685 (-),score=262.74 TRINITY_DN1072_c3_g1_i1:2-1903(-)